MEMQGQANMPVEQAPTMAGVLEPQAAEQMPPQAGGAPPPGPGSQVAGQGTFNGPLTTKDATKQVVNGRLEEGKNLLFVSNNGRIVFDKEARILGGRTPDGQFLPVDQALLFSLSVEGI